MPIKVLLIDGERHVARLLQVNLERQGYQVAIAYTCKEGQEKITQEKPDLVIMETALPDTDGLILLETLKKSHSTQDMPVIIHSKRPHDLDVTEGYRVGADLYLTKHSTTASEVISYVKRICAGINLSTT